jgi:sugar phosphate isomerase/epimerase
MPRPLILCTGPWADLPLEELASQAAEWGYQGVELTCWGDHFEVQRALSEEGYAQERLELLGRLELTVPSLSNPHVGQAVGDRIDTWHRDLLPDYVWGDGQPEGVRQRAVEELVATARAAHELGCQTLAGPVGSPLWPAVANAYLPRQEAVEEALAEWAHRWHPILDVCAECGLRYACRVGPGQAAFDLYSALRLVEVLGEREEFGFALDAVGLHWQGVDPAEFVRRLGPRIFHVYVGDAAITLDGRSGLLGSYLPPADARRGWQARSPGRGGIDWEGIIRALNGAGYDGPLAVWWDDPGMDRNAGAAEAGAFVQRVDFEPPPRGPDAAFH